MQYVVSKKGKQFWKKTLLPRNKASMLNIWLETLNLKTTLRTDYVAIQYSSSSVWIEESKEAR